MCSSDLPKPFWKAKIDPSKKVLVYGSSGSVGTYAVQLARHLGMSVTGVCSAGNIAMIKSLGADEVIDYKQRDYSALPSKFDIVFDAVGKTTRSAAKKVLKTGGVFVSVNMLTSEQEENLLELKGMAENGLIKPYIDKVFPLEEVEAAHEYVDRGRKRGNVVIEVAGLGD